MAACESEADGAGGDGGAEGEKLTESTDCGGSRDREGDGFTGEELDEDVEGFLRFGEEGV